MVGNGNGSDLPDRVEQIRSEAEEGLREFGRSARASADEVKKEAIKLLHAAADAIRREARERGASGEIRGGVDDVASGLEHAAHYLKKNTLEDMGAEVSQTVKRNPWQSVAIVFVVGVVIGLLLRGDSDADQYRNRRR